MTKNKKKRKFKELSLIEESEEAKLEAAGTSKPSRFRNKVFAVLQSFRKKLVSVFSPKKARNVSVESSVEKSPEKQNTEPKRKRKAEELSKEETESKKRRVELELQAQSSDDIVQAEQKQGEKRSRSEDEDSGLERAKRFKGEKEESGPSGIATPVTLDRFLFYKDLGAGSFGMVRLAKDKVTAEMVAVKMINKVGAHLQSVMSERRILEVAKECPFLVHGKAAFQTKNNIYMVMDYINGGTLSNLINTEAPLDEISAQILTAEIVCGLTFLHSRGIVHRQVTLFCDITLYSRFISSNRHILHCFLQGPETSEHSDRQCRPHQDC
ncbi:protein kinase C delta type-like [Xenopus tropicalis]|uniref:non-specific serine/threonine protein kinase n=1 Tax=Xenopus tropicalis TaxID=8364 RepID=A0A8J1JKI4_XENTR|nr:protein kinase C delta type-like [Xenopus tropicalis]